MPNRQELREIAPDEKHPLSGKTYGELWEAFDKSGTEPIKIDLGTLSGI